MTLAQPRCVEQTEQAQASQRGGGTARSSTAAPAAAVAAASAAGAARPATAGVPHRQVLSPYTVVRVGGGYATPESRWHPQARVGARPPPGAPGSQLWAALRLQRAARAWLHSRRLARALAAREAEYLSEGWAGSDSEHAQGLGGSGAPLHPADAAASERSDSSGSSYLGSSEEVSDADSAESTAVSVVGLLEQDQDCESPLSSVPERSSPEPCTPPSPSLLPASPPSPPPPPPAPPPPPPPPPAAPPPALPLRPAMQAFPPAAAAEPSAASADDSRAPLPPPKWLSVRCLLAPFPLGPPPAAAATDDASEPSAPPLPPKPAADGAAAPPLPPKPAAPRCSLGPPAAALAAALRAWELCALDRRRRAIPFVPGAAAGSEATMATVSTPRLYRYGRPRRAL